MTSPSIYSETPILLDLRRFLGIPKNVLDDHGGNFPMSFVMKLDCGLFSLLFDIVISKVFGINSEIEMISGCFPWMYVPYSVSECISNYKSFLGFVHIRIPSSDNTFHDIYHGSYYLPIGCFTKDGSKGVLGRIIVRGKEKYFTSYESISPDIPCLGRDNILSVSKYSKLLNRIFTIENIDSNSTTVVSSKEHTNTKLWGIKYDGSSELALSAMKRMSCTYKAYNSTHYVPINVVHALSTLGRDKHVLTTRVSTYSPNVEYLLVNHADYERLLHKNKSIFIVSVIAKRQFAACASGFKGITNTNDYINKTIKQPSQILSDHVHKCVRKNGRNIAILPQNVFKSVPILKHLLHIDHTNINVITPHFNRFVLSATCETPFASVANEHRTVVNFSKTNKQSCMRQVQTSQFAFVSSTATPDGAEIGMSKHLTPGTKYTATLPAYKIVIVKQRVIELLGNCLNTQPSEADFLSMIHCNDTRCFVTFNSNFIGLYTPTGGDSTIECDNDKPRELLKLAEEIPMLHIVYERMSVLSLGYGQSGRLYRRTPLGVDVLQSNVVFRGSVGSILLSSKKDHAMCISACLNNFSKHNDPSRNTLGFGMLKQATSRSKVNDLPCIVHNSESKTLLSKNLNVDFIEAIVLPLAINWCVEDGMVVSESFVKKATSIQTKMMVVANNVRNQKILSILPNNFVRYDDDLWGVAPGTVITYEMPLVAVSFDDVHAAIAGRHVVYVDDVEPAAKRQKLSDNRRYAIVYQGKRIHYGFVFQKCSWIPYSEKSKISCITTRCLRPTYGYKFATMHGQKGVVCRILADKDMPRGTISGTIPDVLVHPNTLLSRLTMGQLREGEDRGGGLLHERYTLPHMGAGLVTRNCLCPHKVMLLHQKNIPEDKFHMRHKLHVYNLFTKQPTEGRANEGSSRLGEMEMSAFMATGATVSLKRLGTHAEMMHCAKKCVECGTILDTFVTKCECEEPNITEPIHIKYVGSLSKHILSTVRIGVKIEHLKAIKDTTTTTTTGDQS